MKLEDMTFTSITNSFMNSYRTGNIFYDIIISSLIMTFISYINEYDINTFYNIYKYIINFFLKNNTTLVFRGIETRDKLGIITTYPKTIISIFHYVTYNNISNLKNFKEINKYKNIYDDNNNYDNDDDNNDNDNLVLYGIQNGIYAINNDIKCIVDSYKHKLSSQSSNNKTFNNNSVFETTDINITLRSNNLSPNELKNFVDKCIKEHDKYMRKIQLKKKYYFEYNYNDNNDDDDDNYLWKYMEFNFKSNKTFDNLYFPDKSKFINTFDFFLNNKEWYKKKGLPYRFGILMYGPPGTGKTSTIKAIINKTNRHAVVIPLSKINKASELKNIFFNNKINGKKIYSNEKIIIFEDIDCMTNIVKNRNDINDNNNNDIKNNHNNHNVIVINNDDSNSIKKNFSKKSDDNNDNITLSVLLNLLDGIMEDEGRIIIITTNHPDKLDPALTRPGRIDYHLDLNYANHDTIKNIIQNCFNKNIDIYLSKIKNIKNNIWSPAEIIQLCVKFNDNIDFLLEYLINNEPIKF